MFVVWFRDVHVWQQQLVSYSSKHALWSLFNVPFLRIWSVTRYPWGTCNSTTLLMTPQAFDTYYIEQTAIIHMTMNLSVPTTVLNTKWLPCYKGHLLSPSTNEPRLAICHQYISLHITMSLQIQNVYISEHMQFPHNFTYSQPWGATSILFIVQFLAFNPEITTESRRKSFYETSL